MVLSILAVASAALLLAPHHATLAATINVSTTADELNADGNCSLREAIQAANTDTAVDTCAAGSGADIIDLPAGTYSLSITGPLEDANLTGDLDITSDLTINGNGAIIQACDSSGGPCTGIDRVFHIVGPFNSVTISGSTIRNGSGASGGGSGIYDPNVGTLTVIDSTVSDNTEGGIYGSTGTLTLSNSNVTNNIAAGIHNFGSLTITDSSVNGNNGVGIENFAGTANLTNSTVSDNYDYPDGAITNGLHAVLTLTNTTVSGNHGRFGGGIWNVGTATLSNSSVIGNAAGEVGGGIYNTGFEQTGGTLTITNSSVTGNTSGFDGGGIYNADQGTLVINSTVSGNSARRNGGGIVNFTTAELTVANSTISDNSANGTSSDSGGGGIWNVGSATLSNSTVSGNTAAAGSQIHVPNGSVTLTNAIVASGSSSMNCAGAVMSLGHNLSSDASCAFAGAGDLNNTDPMLGPLANNGGPTKTHALQASSPAIDAGSGDCPPPATDQRGVSRPQDGDGSGGATCDIGSFELESVGTPGPVGGISLDAQLHRSSRGGAGLLAGAITGALAAAAVALGGGVWYMRRRRVR